MSSETQSSIIYKELIGHRASIRLLDILPPSDDEPDNIECTLHEAFLDTTAPPTYEALPYTWGDPSDHCSINLNGHPFPVRQNLFDALHHLRLADCPRTFWIDAICINQADVGEKNHQVSQMHVLYYTAPRVVIWLGKAADDSGRAMELIRQAASIANSETPPSSNTILHPGFRKKCRDALGTSRPDSMKLFSVMSHEELALGMFFQRRWWRRVWIVQEIVYASTAILICGEDKLPWDNIVQAWPILMDAVSQRWRPALLRGRITGIINTLSKGKVRRRSVSLLNVILDWYLNKFRMLEATDPRDHVFATLNLDRANEQLSGSPSKPVTVYYTKDVATVFAEAAVAISQAHNDLSILAYVETMVDEDDAEALTKIDSYKRVPELSLVSGKPVYNASKGLEPNWGFGKDIQSGKTWQIQARALCIGLVSMVGMDVYGRQGGADLMFSEMLETCATYERLLKLGDQTVKEVVLRTLAGNRTCLGESLISNLPYTANEFDELDQTLRDASLRFMTGRKFMIINKGYVAVGPRTALPGDTVYIIPRCPIPIVMRERRILIARKCNIDSRENENSYLTSEVDRWQEVIGPCYAHSLMDGEAQELCKEYVPTVWQWENIKIQ